MADPTNEQPVSNSASTDNPDEEELKRLEEERKRKEAIWCEIEQLVSNTPDAPLRKFIAQMLEYKTRFEEDYTPKVVKLVWRHRVGAYVLL